MSVLAHTWGTPSAGGQALCQARKPVTVTECTLVELRRSREVGRGQTRTQAPVDSLPLRTVLRSIHLGECPLGSSSEALALGLGALIDSSVSPGDSVSKPPHRPVCPSCSMSL